MKLSLQLCYYHLHHRKVSVPGSLWSGKQRLVPRVTNYRRSAILRWMLSNYRSLHYLNNPYLTEEMEAPTRELFQWREQRREDGLYWKIYRQKWERSYPNYTFRSFMEHTLDKLRSFDDCVPPTNLSDSKPNA